MILSVQRQIHGAISDAIRRHFGVVDVPPFAIEVPPTRALGDLAVAVAFQLARTLRNRFYFDEFYEATVIKLHDSIAAIADWFDQWIIAGLIVRGTHGTTELFGRALRLVQTGNLQTYAFLSVLGVAVVLYFVLGK